MKIKWFFFFQRLSESSLNFLNSFGPDLNTTGKSLAQAESAAASTSEQQHEIKHETWRQQHPK